MLKRPRNTHIWPEDPLGHYPEPPWVSARLFEEETFGAKDDLIADFCCGWGRIPHNAAVAGYKAIGCDVVDRRHEPQSLNGFEFVRGDFLKDSLSIDSTASAVFNSPYSGDNIQLFVERALTIVRFKVAALIPLRRLPAMHWIKGKPLETVWLLTPRPSLPAADYIRAGNEPGGGGQDYCWLIFNRQTAVARPCVKWLHRDKSAL